MKGVTRPCSSVPRLAAAAVVLAGVAGCGGGGGAPTTTATPSTSAGGAARGRELYAARGCRSCHSLDGSPGVGPTWKGLAGSRVKLVGGGGTVAADDAYLFTAITDPDKQIVAGYQPGVMSGTIPRGSVSRADAKALVAYIASLG